MQRRPRVVVSLALLSIVAALGVAELATRLFVRESSPVLLQPFVDTVEQDHGGDFQLVFESDSELFWRLKPDVRLSDDARPFSGLVSNAQGLREDHEIPLAKPPGELRILFLGDSVTFGYLVRQDECFVERTERELAARFPDRRIECINAGVPGYSLFQGLRFLETHGLAFAPDLVVLEFGWNDRAQWPGGSDAERLAVLQSARPPAWLGWSRLVQGVAAGLAPAPAGAGDRPRVSPDEFRTLLERTRAVARASGADLLVLVGAGRFNLNPEVTEKGRTEYQIQSYLVARDTPLAPDGGPALVDGVAVLRALLGELSSEQILFDGIHPTAAGHRAYAAALAERIEAWLRARG